jgi:glyoxylase-like metal-dependent hydrolase (beta-lactamase superfamily II)
MRELAPGLWHWQARHPDWQASEPWNPNVSSYASDDGERLLFFDPIAPPSELEELATERETAIVLTAPWHERDSQGLVERLGVPVYTPRPDTAQDLMERFGLTAEQAGDGAPDVVWLLEEGKGEAHVFMAGERLPVGVETFRGHKPNDTVLWIESKHAVICGDTIADLGDGLAINERWLSYWNVTRDDVVEGLRPLLELPVEHVLATHGGPHDRAVLERVLA